MPTPVPRLVGAILATVAVDAHAAAGIDARIQSVFGPVADALAAVVFAEIPLPGGLKAAAIVIWLAVAAVVFTVYFRFINLRGFAHGFRIIRGDYADPAGPGEVSHFQALTSALSGTVGPAGHRERLRVGLVGLEQRARAGRRARDADRVDRREHAPGTRE